MLNSIKISKELLSEVLNVYVYEIDFIQDERLFYKFTTVNGSMDFNVDNINIYKLAYKCKEWALNLKKRYVIKSMTSIAPSGSFGVAIISSRLDFVADTEIEAVIKACEWILKEVNAK